MGNNIAYSTFESTIITIYNHSALTLELLDELAAKYRGTNIDSGGALDLEAYDGRVLEDICIQLVNPGWVAVQSEDDESYIDPDEWETEERDTKWNRITSRRWGWR